MSDTGDLNGSEDTSAEMISDTKNEDDMSGEDSEDSDETDDDDDDDESDESDEDEEGEEVDDEQLEGEDGNDDDIDDDGSETDEEGSSSDSDSDVESKDPSTVCGEARPISELLADTDSDGDMNVTRCPICLTRLGSQSVGYPESCDHGFCLECILEWAKNVNTCPVDRSVFHLILVCEGLEGVVHSRIPVGDKQLNVEDDPVVHDATFCEVCGRSDREDRLLLCDGCDLGYHLECLDPPLTSVPRGDWFCVDCAPHHRATQREPTTSRSVHSAPRSVQQIARTIVAERVRSAVARSRSQRRRILSTDSEDELTLNSASAGEQSTERRVVKRKRTTNSPRAASEPKRKRKRKTTSKRRKTSTKKRKRRRRTTKVRKVVKINEDGTTSIVTKRTRRKKRKVKRKKGKKSKFLKSARTKRSQPATVKCRLADRLGIGLPPTGLQIPRLVKSVSSVAERYGSTETRSAGGEVLLTGGLSIMGNRDDLDPFCSDGEENGSLHSATPSVRQVVLTRSDPVTVGGSLDVLGDILMCQTMLHRDSTSVTIKRDGSLLPPPTSRKLANRSTSQSGLSASSVKGVIGDLPRVNSAVIANPSVINAAAITTPSGVNAAVITNPAEVNTTVNSNPTEQNTATGAGDGPSESTAGYSGNAGSEQSSSSAGSDIPSTIVASGSNPNPSSGLESIKSAEYGSGDSDKSDIDKEKEPNKKKEAESKTSVSLDGNSMVAELEKAKNIEEDESDIKSAAVNKMGDDLMSEDMEMSDGSSGKSVPVDCNRSRSLPVVDSSSAVAMETLPLVKSESGVGGIDGNLEEAMERLDAATKLGDEEGKKEKSEEQEKQSEVAEDGKRRRKSRWHDDNNEASKLSDGGDKSRNEETVREKSDSRSRRRSGSRSGDNRVEKSPSHRSRDSPKHHRSGGRSRPSSRSRSRSRSPHRGSRRGARDDRRDQRRSRSRSANRRRRNRSRSPKDRRDRSRDRKRSRSRDRQSPSGDRGKRKRSPSPAGKDRFPRSRRNEAGSSRNRSPAVPELDSLRDRRLERGDSNVERSDLDDRSVDARIERMIGKDEDFSRHTERFDESRHPRGQRSRDEEFDANSSHIAVISSTAPIHGGIPQPEEPEEFDDENSVVYDPTDPTDDMRRSRSPSLHAPGNNNNSFRSGPLLAPPHYLARPPHMAPFDLNRPPPNFPQQPRFFGRPPPPHEIRHPHDPGQGQMMIPPGGGPPVSLSHPHFMFNPALSGTPIDMRGQQMRLPPGQMESSSPSRPSISFSHPPPPPPPPARQQLPPQPRSMPPPGAMQQCQQPPLQGLPPRSIALPAGLESVPMLLRTPVEFPAVPSHFVIMPPQFSQPLQFADQQRAALVANMQRLMCNAGRPPGMPDFLRIPLGQPQSTVLLPQQLMLRPSHGNPTTVFQVGLPPPPHEAAVQQHLNQMQFGIPGNQHQMMLPPGLPPQLQGLHQSVNNSPMRQPVLYNPPPDSGSSTPLSNDSPCTPPTPEGNMLRDFLSVCPLPLVRPTPPGLPPGLSPPSPPRTGHDPNNVRTIQLEMEQSPDSPADSPVQLDPRIQAAGRDLFSRELPPQMPTLPVDVLAQQTTQNRLETESNDSSSAAKPFPADPRALVQYLLQQTREATSSGADKPQSSENGNFSALASLQRLMENPASVMASQSVAPPQAESESESSAESPPPLGDESPMDAVQQSSRFSPDGKPEDQENIRKLKLQRQAHVVELVKAALKPHYAAGKITKAEYKDVMRSAVPKICHSKSGNVEMSRVQGYIDSYVTKIIQSRKKNSAAAKHGRQHHKSRGGDHGRHKDSA